MTDFSLKPDLTPSAQESIESLFDGFSFEDIVNDIVSGKFSPETGSLINRIIGLFMGELKTALALIGTIAAIVLISAFVNNLSSSLGKKGPSDATAFAVFLYIAAVAATAFESAGKFVITTLDDITILVHSIIPAMSMLCVSGGEAVRATLTHPVIFFVCSALAGIIRNVITPLVLLRAVSVLLCAMSTNSGLDEFSQLFAKLHKTVLSFSMSIFAGILGISSFAAASFDSLAARGVKFAIGAAVPVVGGSIAEAMSSIAGSAMLLKNAVGLGGVIMLFGIFAIPLLKLSALSLALRLTAAFTAPVAEKRVTDVLKKLGDCIDMLFSSIACMGTIMIIAIAAIM